MAGCGDGYELVAQALVRLGVKFMFGVVGIPVTPLASSAQVCVCVHAWGGGGALRGGERI